MSAWVVYLGAIFVVIGSFLIGWGIKTAERIIPHDGTAVIYRSENQKRIVFDVSHIPADKLIIGAKATIQYVDVEKRDEPAKMYEVKP